LGKRTFKDKGCNLSALARDVESWFMEREYETQGTERGGRYFVQAKKKGTLRAITGTQVAMKVTIEGNPDDFTVQIGTGKWISNIASAGTAAFFTFGLTAITGVVGAIWTKKTERDLWDYIESQAIFTQQAITPPPPQTTSIPPLLCPVCGKNASFIQQYQRYYCHTCRQYVEEPPPPPPLPPPESSKKKKKGKKK